MKTLKISLIASAILTTSLFSSQTALSYIQNINKSVVMKSMVDKIENINSSIGLYIVNTGGQPSYSSSSDKLSFGFPKSEMYEYSNLMAEDMAKIDGTPCDLDSVNPMICSSSDTDGVQYNFRYDSTGKIPVGIEIDPSDILGSTTMAVNNKLIAYMNSKNIIYKGGKFVKYFSDTTLGMVKQQYYIKKENPSIQFVDMTSTSASGYTQGDVIYSPDGKGGFLIYMTQTDAGGNKYWDVIGEPKITLAVNSVIDENNIISKESGDESNFTGEFDIHNINADTFGALKCVKRNAASNYGNGS